MYYSEFNTHTYTPKYIYTIRTTPVKSTAVAEPEVEEEVKAAVYQPTRFDRIEILQRKEHAKVSEADVDALSFSYDDFQSAVTNTEYSFERDAIIKGCAIEYQPKGVFVDIGAKLVKYSSSYSNGFIAFIIGRAS